MGRLVLRQTACVLRIEGGETEQSLQIAFYIAVGSTFLSNNFNKEVPPSHPPDQCEHNSSILHIVPVGLYLRASKLCLVSCQDLDHVSYHLATIRYLQSMAVLVFQLNASLVEP